MGERRLGFPKDFFVDVARQSGAYNRLKTKFEPMDTTTGLAIDAIAVGDLFDMGLLYATLHTGVERLWPEMRDLSWVIKHAVQLVPPRERRPYRGLLSLLNSTDDLNALDRKEPVFDLPVDLDKLMENPYSPSGIQFEITHYPGGLLICPIPSNWTQYEVVVADRDMTDEPKYFGPIFAETGLYVGGFSPAPQQVQ